MQILFLKKLYKFNRDRENIGVFFVSLQTIIPQYCRNQGQDIDNKTIKKQNNAKIKNEIRC